ncbi:DUF6705 family protein [uncultured Kordia sp.]|uniref:DUF6705 family protein n=1 Tax=uncultured Kordia sp. TaxID=507699 RepID=UPI00261CD26D|nr:DUF6705 family protein [uncultured Kordia sp.]
MKKLILIIIALTLSTVLTSIKAQTTAPTQSINTPFLGTWEWQNENRIFRVFLFAQNQTIKGHFEMVQINNGSETIIYKSNKPYNSQTPQSWHPVISGGHDGKDFDGRIMDNSLDYEAPEWDGYTLWHAQLRMKILQTANCIGCATTASWKVAYFDLTPNNKLPLNIPTDIILTKVQ